MTRFRRNAVTTATFVLVLGCAAPEQGAAQDAPPKQEKTDDRKGGEPEKPKRKFLATVQDKFQPDPFQLHGAVLFVPEVSLFGGGGGEEKQVLVVKRGAAEIQCPFERIEKLEVKGTNEEHLELKVTLRAAGDAPAEVIEGTVRSSLLLKGTFGKTQLVTEVKLREVVSVTLAEER